MQKSFVSSITICTIFIFSLSGLAQQKTKRSNASFPPPAPSKPVPFDPIREADRLFAHGEDPGRDRQSLETIERALAADGNNYQLLWRAARSYFFVGDTASNKSEKVGYFDKGIAIAQRAIAQQPNAVEGHFWLAVNYGGQSELKGIITAVQTVKKIRAEMEAVLRINAAYEDASAYLALGEIDRQLPRLLGGNSKRGLSYFEQGVRLAPNNLDLKLSLAEAYLEDGRKDEGRRLLQEIVQAPVNPARAKEIRHIQDKARKLLSK
ncbi:MAG TPA: TRAP transporter TatT component family protein [Blastocatellia bacterium]|nr:TRAP transporter TatT component family protein [Blastocatellia bacterium]